jgi:hypothetical protein
MPWWERLSSKLQPPDELRFHPWRHVELAEGGPTASILALGGDVLMRINHQEVCMAGLKAYDLAAALLEAAAKAAPPPGGERNDLPPC